jgi:arylsulfatase A
MMLLNRQKFIIAACIVALMPGSAIPLLGSGNEQKPNIIIILADDYGYGDVGCYGSKRFKTPHIDALAAGGLRFTDFHSNGAVCSPTRAALLTGRYQQRTGITGVVTAAGHRHTGLDLGETTFADILKPAGYVTALFGKWHLGYHPNYNPVRQGFDEFIGFVSGNVDYHAHLDQTGMEDWWKQDELNPECGYTTDIITDHGVDFIQRHSGKPFLLYIAHEAPHYPYQGRKDPPRYTRENGRTKDPVTPEVYKEMIEVMDESVGRIYQAVIDAGLIDNTLIIFFSDNGPSGLGSAGSLRGKKGQIWEGGHRVPAIAYWPGKIEAGRVSNLTAMGADLLPTMAAISGTAIPDNLKLDGINLLPHLIENKEPAPRPLFWSHNNQLAIREGDFKLITNKSFSETSLYNLRVDLGEENKIAAQHPDLVQKLLKILKAWQKDVTKDVLKRT